MNIKERKKKDVVCLPVITFYENLETNCREYRYQRDGITTLLHS